MMVEQDTNHWLSVVNSYTGELIHESWHNVGENIGWCWEGQNETVSEVVLFEHVQKILNEHPEGAVIGWLRSEFWKWAHARIEQEAT
jgi:hypothetical protein